VYAVVAAAADNKQPADVSTAGVNAGMGVAELQKGMGAMALVAPASSAVEQEQLQQERPVAVSKVGAWIGMFV
jgi:hypothetical protein